jgi:hypothetical protein
MVTLRDTEKDSRRILSWEDLRTYSIDWYKKQGIDFGCMGSK